MDPIAEEGSAEVVEEAPPPSSEPSEVEVKSPAKKRVKKEKIDTSVKTSSDGAPPPRRRATKPREEAPLDISSLLAARAEANRAARSQLIDSWFPR